MTDRTDQRRAMRGVRAKRNPLPPETFDQKRLGRLEALMDAESILRLATWDAIFLALTYPQEARRMLEERATPEWLNGWMHYKHPKGEDNV